jgi:hypothetical protein
VVGDGTGQYIDTGITPTSDTKMTIKFKLNSTNPRIFAGCFLNTETNTRFGFSTIGGKFGVYISDLTDSTDVDVDLEYHTMSLSGDCMYSLDGVEYDSGCAPFGTSTQTIHLYSSWWNGSAAYPTDMEILSLGIEQSGTLVRDMIPIGNGQHYDKVSGNTFGTPVGTLVTEYTPALRETVGGAWLDAEGNPLGVYGSVQLGTKGPLWQQSAPYTIIQSDADFTVFGGANFWGDGSTVWNAKSYTDADTFVNGTTGNWFKCYTTNTGANGEKIIAEGLSYAFDQVLTPEEYNQMIRWLGSCQLTGGTLIPYPVTAGTGIGPNGEWYTPDGTHVYLVEDA